MTKTPFGRHADHDRRQPDRHLPGRHPRRPRCSSSPSSIAGAIAGLAGWLLAIRTSGATANLGVGMLFQAFAAVVIGGVSLKGGIGQIPGVYAGVLLLLARSRRRSISWACRRTTRR